MKKVIATITILLAGLLGWLFLDRPEPPFSAKVTIAPASKETGYFAEIDKNNKVVRVIVADQEFIDSGKVGDPKNWLETSPTGEIRKNYAGKGYTYDKVRDAFIPPKPQPYAILDEINLQWRVPVIDNELTNTASQ